MPAKPRPATARCCRRIAAAFLSLVAVAGCTPGGGLPPMADYNGAVYRLGVDDQLRIITFGSDQLSNVFRVDDAGDIDLPVLGDITAAGLTTRELADRIAREFKTRNVFRDPSVAVEVVAYRPIFILGEVNRPGQYPYLPGMSVLSAIAIAGGYTYRASQGPVGVVRSDGKTTQVGRSEPQAFVGPGDVMTVYERPF